MAVQAQLLLALCLASLCQCLQASHMTRMELNQNTRAALIEGRRAHPQVDW
jgi:hypothetical protein